MALTPIQRRVCQLLAERRRTSGESYVAGGVALGAALGTLRLSRDLDLFHDTTEAVAHSFHKDAELLVAAGYRVVTLRERPGLVEAVVEYGGERLLIEWARDSAFRFFPLIEHADLGLTLHPFDLATNKVLALVGRLEPRDWVDVIECDRRLQPLGYLAWAACGKDPGFTPRGVLAHARRTSRYTQTELDALAFEGEPPRAADLARVWHGSLEHAEAIIDTLPADRAGHAVLNLDGNVCKLAPDALAGALSADQIMFHEGRIGGAWPRLVSPSA